MKRNWRNRGQAVRYGLQVVSDELRAASLIRASYFVIVALALLMNACDSKQTAETHDIYTCPMHPTVVSDRPGTCPVCAMDLVRKARPGEEVEITEDLARLIKSPNENIVASVKTIRGQYKSVPVSVEAQGVVTYDTRNIYTIASRAGGRLEKVYLKYVFQPVLKGQKIAEVYSPELIAAQRELLFLLTQDAGNKTLIDAARHKLALLGFTTGQINDLMQRKEVTNTFSIYSPYSGYVITGQQAPAARVSMSSVETAGSGMSNGMGGTSAGTTPASSPVEDTASGVLVREGNYVSAGQTLFSIVNNNALRIELDLPATQSGSVKKGDTVKLDFGNGNRERASVDFVQPFFSEGQDFLKLRVYTRRTEGLHIGHLVKATIALSTSESLWVPKEAVLDLGTEKIVFIKEKGVLKPKMVTTGIIANGQVEVKSGLASSEEIAANAQYLVDSESFIKTVK